MIRDISQNVTKSPEPIVQLLTFYEQTIAREIGERMRAELLTLLGSVPSEVRRTRALGRHLNVDRNTCHRIFSATQQRAEDGLGVITKLPGVQALRQFVAAVSAAGAKPQDVQSASAAIDRFADLIQELGGSLTVAQKRCVSTLNTIVGPAALVESSGLDEDRKQMYFAASRVVGRRLDAHIVLTVVREAPGNPDRLEHIGVNALVGHRQVRTDAMPLAMTYSYTPTGSTESSDTSPKYADLVAGEDARPLLTRFCSQPLPRLTRRERSGAHHQQVIDIAPHTESSDIVTGSKFGPVTHVIHEDVPVLNNVVRVRYPSEQLVFDVYLQRSLAMSSVPTVGAYSWHPSLVDDLSKYWFERVPMPIRLEVLGPSIRNARTNAWHRHQELTEYVFSEIGSRGEDFVGYRITQTYPCWGLYYYLSSDFATAPTSNSA